MTHVRLLILLAFTLLFGKVHAEIYAVVVGISNYKNISSLHLCENDALVIAELYKLKTPNVITVTGEYATKDWIKKCISQQFARAKKGDMIVFSFSGHGYPGGFCPYDMTNNVTSGLSYKDITSVMKGSKASQKIIIADACMSGAIRVNKHDITGKYKGKDVLLFLSSRGNEYSAENTFMKNGLFTTYFIKGMQGQSDVNKDKIITAKEMFNYVNTQVANKSKGKQHPVMWGNFDDNFVMFNWN